jgi:hypothetical protein
MRSGPAQKWRDLVLRERSRQTAAERGVKAGIGSWRRQGCEEFIEGEPGLACLKDSAAQAVGGIVLGLLS